MRTTVGRFSPPRSRGDGGFTLIELMVTMVIAGLLFALAVGGYRPTRPRRRTAARPKPSSCSCVRRISALSPRGSIRGGSLADTAGPWVLKRNPEEDCADKTPTRPTRRTSPRRSVARCQAEAVSRSLSTFFASSCAYFKPRGTATAGEVHRAAGGLATPVPHRRSRSSDLTSLHDQGGGVDRPCLDFLMFRAHLRRRANGADAGFTLLEVLVAFLIIAIIAASGTTLTIRGLRATARRPAADPGPEPRQRAGRGYARLALLRRAVGEQRQSRRSGFALPKHEGARRAGELRCRCRWDLGMAGEGGEVGGLRLRGTTPRDVKPLSRRVVRFIERSARRSLQRESGCDRCGDPVHRDLRVART